MNVSKDATFQLVVRKLTDEAILLLSDPKLPSVVNTVSKGRVKGSWWASPESYEILGALRRLESHPDALEARLVSEKVTFVHRRIWPEFLTVATSGQEWQLGSLSARSRKLLRLVQELGELRTDIIQWSGVDGKIGDSVRELEKKLLVFTKEIHTESGAHAKVVQSWNHWSSQTNFQARSQEVEAAKAKLDALLQQLNQKYGGSGRFPWYRVK